MAKLRLSEQESLTRYGRTESIIADYERQHGFSLPAPWPVTVAKLLLNGLTDPELHLIFDTIAAVEIASGRMAPREPDYAE